MNGDERDEADVGDVGGMIGVQPLYPLGIRFADSLRLGDTSIRRIPTDNRDATKGVSHRGRPVSFSVKPDYRSPYIYMKSMSSS